MFENHWLEHLNFMNIISTTWNMEVRANNLASIGCQQNLNFLEEFSRDSPRDYQSSRPSSGNAMRFWKS
jgi:hypothetical protein